jgi:hypothetical protein
MFVIVTNKVGETLKIQEFDTPAGAIKWADKMRTRFNAEVTNVDPRKRT